MRGPSLGRPCGSKRCCEQHIPLHRDRTLWFRASLQRIIIRTVSLSRFSTVWEMEDTYPQCAASTFDVCGGKPFVTALFSMANGARAKPHSFEG